jgi:hypothetical protein
MYCVYSFFPLLNCLVLTLSGSPEGKCWLEQQVGVVISRSKVFKPTIIFVLFPIPLVSVAGSGVCR